MNRKLLQLTVAASSVLLAACHNNKRLAGMYNIPQSKPTIQNLTPLAPPGMVFVEAGSIYEKTPVIDTSMAVDTTTKVVTVSAFFMDETEVTNKQYGLFMNWVADSIAVTDYLKDDKYFLKGKSKVASASKSKGKNTPATAAAPASQGLVDNTKFIDWDKLGGSTPLWQSNDPVIKEKLLGHLYTIENGKPKLIPESVKYKFTHLAVDRNGQSNYITEDVSVVPDYKVWSNDFPNAQMSIMDNNYFTNKGYQDYPVVGVNWKQARSYASWRTLILKQQVGTRSLAREYALEFALPTEAQWEYAASKNIKPEDFNKLSAVNVKDRKSKKNVEVLGVNFKQQEGDYRKDGGTFTLPVRSYAPNAVGIYNLLGNVSEWTLDAFSPSYKELVHDLNPVLLYDADDSESDAMKRKVVRGGSWKDNANLLTPSTRSYEVQNVSHSYLGFRCVMPAPDVIIEQTKTRKIAKN